MINALEAAVEAIGGQTALANLLGVPQPTVHFWLFKSKSGLPAQFCKRVEQATNGKVRAEQLRPDVFQTPISAKVKS